MAVDSKLRGPTLADYIEAHWDEVVADSIANVILAVEEVAEEEDRRRWCNVSFNLGWEDSYSSLEPSDVEITSRDDMGGQWFSTAVNGKGKFYQKFLPQLKADVEEVLRDTVLDLRGQ